MRKLSRWVVLVAAAVSALGVLASTVDKPARVISALVKRALIVEAVYPETRELKVLDSEGNRFRVSVDPLVAKFDAIKPRDRIVAEYVESVALVVAPAGTEPPIGDMAAVEIDPQNEKPFIRSAETRLVTADVEAINVTDRIVTIKTAEGDLHDVMWFRMLRLISSTSAIRCGSG